MQKYSWYEMELYITVFCHETGYFLLRVFNERFPFSERIFGKKNHIINRSGSKTEFVMDEIRHRNGTCTRVNNLVMQLNSISQNSVIKAVIIRLL